jgi:soluble lytic murein transglycosylase-like protein
MNRSLLVCVLAALASLPGAAESRSLEDAYAGALVHFDHALSASQSHRLAQRALAEADAYGLDARLVVALVAVESSWNPKARSPAGARGLGQLMPATARELRVDPADPSANLHGTVRYLRSLLDHYGYLAPQARYELALAAYNAGQGTVDRFGTIPPYPQTRAYVRGVISLWRRLAGM